MTDDRPQSHDNADQSGEHQDPQRPDPSREPGELILPPEVDSLLQQGKKIEAVRVIRQSLGLDLRDAKNVADQRAHQLGLGRRSKACFVATAAFGGPFEAEVAQLRRFRDDRLEQSAAGRAFVRVYETFGPALARRIEHRPAARAACRAMLRPIARWASRRTPTE
jgi:hypothetical protein